MRTSFLVDKNHAFFVSNLTYESILKLLNYFWPHKVFKALTWNQVQLYFHPIFKNFSPDCVVLLTKLTRGTGDKTGQRGDIRGPGGWPNPLQRTSWNTGMYPYASFIMNWMQIRGFMLQVIIKKKVWVIMTERNRMSLQQKIHLWEVTVE